MKFPKGPILFLTAVKTPVPTEVKRHTCVFLNPPYFCRHQGSQLAIVMCQSFHLQPRSHAYLGSSSVQICPAEPSGLLMKGKETAAEAATLIWLTSVSKRLDVRQKTAADERADEAGQLLHLRLLLEFGSMMWGEVLLPVHLWHVWVHALPCWQTAWLLKRWKLHVSSEPDGRLTAFW